MLDSSFVPADTEIRKESVRSIPSLDGLRAVSVFAVILAHTQSGFLDRIPFSASLRNGVQGVAVFFVISGFLITHLLLKELGREGGISLKRFYLRRTLRIFPPFYVFLLIIGFLSLVNVVHFRTPDMVAAATYTRNYFPLRDGRWLLAHSWSLSLEEQFYLLWPLSMMLFSRRANFGIATGVILLSPVSRVVTYYAWPSMRDHIGTMLHTRLDTIMAGCLLSLIIEMDVWRTFRRLATHSASLIAAIIFLMAIDTPAFYRWGGKYTLTIGISLENLAIAIILLYAVFRHESLLGKALNLKLMRHLGEISYSLYLWQQLFTGGYMSFPVNIVFILACAELSFLLVERPSFRVRDYLQRKMETRVPTAIYETC